MAIFYNQASLSYNGQITNSNITEGQIIDVISATKTAISASYGAFDNLSYAISIVNDGAAANGITVTDNLGTYEVGNTAYTPLTYVEGSVRLFVNGVLQQDPAVTAGAQLVFSGINIPAGGSALILYEAMTNEYASLDDGASITNTATVTGGGITEPIIISATINALSEARLTIAKAISPATVTENGELTYTFIIQNSGNLPVLAEDNAIVTDTFNPILTDITVTYNGEEWTAGTDYTYSESTGLFTTSEGAITVPGATYSRDPESGVVTVTPGVAVITVSGTI